MSLVTIGASATPYQRYPLGDLRDAFKPSQSPKPREAKYDLNRRIESIYSLLPDAYCLLLSR